MSENPEQPNFDEMDLAAPIPYLALASTQQLVEELLSRCETGVIGLLRDSKTADGHKTYKLRWKGDGFAAGGLCSALQDGINAYRAESEEGLGEQDY